ncbi:MAG TPA: hypothetical protein VHY37_10600 [Tepidisphaeraceae bacterium]|jgi:hypothetical protein|nr:hypothetical protein [Tepidisphaeraceae bacterium]
MAKTNQPVPDSKSPRAESAPDTARIYGREKPEAEGGMGRLDNNAATPCRSADKMEQTVRNRQEPRQINAEDEKDHAKK